MTLTRNPNFPVPDTIKGVIGHFEAFTDIPRPSGKEEVIRNHIISWAEKHGFEYQMDARGNLAVHKKGKPGKEDWPRVILQGHIDMVTKGGNKDKATDAYVDDEGWLRAKGTTLGADNGIGVAMAMSILEDDSIDHGPITALFTVHEETSPMGAKMLDGSIVPEGNKAILLNLDSEEGPKYICSGCAASSDILATFNTGAREAIPESHQVYEIKISGMTGGHSGTDIVKDRGNAILQMGELLRYIKEAGLSFQLLEVNGGTARNIIPTDANCSIAIDPEKFGALSALIREFHRKTGEDGGRSLKPGNAPKMEIEASETQSESPTEQIKLDLKRFQFKRAMHRTLDWIRGRKPPVMALQDEFQTQLLDCLADIHNGPYSGYTPADNNFGGGVEHSNNVGVLETSGDTVKIMNLMRGVDEDGLAENIHQLSRSLFRHGAAKVQATNYVGGAWHEVNSPAIELLLRVAQDFTGAPAKPFIYHAGLECPWVINALQGRFTQISAASFGPIIRDAHSEGEKCDMKSVQECFELAKNVVAAAGTL